MNVGRIIASVTIQNASDLSLAVQCDALVGTGASLMVLPSAWKDRLGKLEFSAEIEVETATQDRVTAEVCGPVRIQIKGFRAILNEVAFINMKPVNGGYEPLIGYIVLEQSLAAVDMITHQLIHLKHFDLKCFSKHALCSGDSQCVQLVVHTYDLAVRKRGSAWLNHYQMSPSGSSV